MTHATELSRWLNSSALSDSERDELLAIENNADEVQSRFFAPLPFGTAGLRGVCGVGLNRMNRHIVRWTTQAFSEILVEDGGGTVAICFDPRHDSREFARCAAEVFAANGLRVRIFDDIRPTPELSFAVRHYKCAAGVNITASHNTQEYNGYKLYGADGAQLPTSVSARVAERMAQIDIFDSVKRVDYDEAFADGLITVLGDEVDSAFLDFALSEVTDRNAIPAVADELRVVYTPFHGAGRKLVPEALHRLGLKHLHCVEAQMVADPSFGTVASPNPENPESFALATELARKVNAHIIIGTDPDSDRIAVLVRDAANTSGYRHITGHKTGALLLDYLLTARKAAWRLPAKPTALKTFVTTDLTRRVAEYHGAQCFDTFTGFKYMAELKAELESSGRGNVIFSYEESYGYMIGDGVRDKDAVTAASIIVEVTAHYLARGMTLIDALDAIYARVGYYDEAAVNLVMPGVDGLLAMQELMARLRNAPPQTIRGIAVESIHDYLPEGSNVLRFNMADSTAVLVRPSGTEPKIKAYILALGNDAANAAEKAEMYASWARNHFSD